MKHPATGQTVQLSLDFVHLGLCRSVIGLFFEILDQSANLDLLEAIAETALGALSNALGGGLVLRHGGGGRATRQIRPCVDGPVVVEPAKLEGPLCIGMQMWRTKSAPMGP